MNLSKLRHIGIADNEADVPAAGVSGFTNGGGIVIYINNIKSLEESFNVWINLYQAGL
jgi:hypothetical protein